MSDARARGIALRVFPLTETSLIVHWLTAEEGRMATVAKGARRPQSPFRGRLDLYFEAQFSYRRSRRSDLHTLREVSLEDTHPGLRRHIACLQHAAYAAAFLEQTTERETPLASVYTLFAGFLRHLETAGPSTEAALAWELKMLCELGQQPDADQTRLSAGARSILAAWRTLDWEGVGRLRLSPAQAQELREFLHGYLIYHLERLPRGRADLFA